MTDEKPAQIGKYEIHSVLGRGGMGIVYQARDPEIDRIVAIKTISISRDLGPISTDIDTEDLLQRLKMEARSAGRLHHPNIVTVFDFGRDGDTSYIVMEYAEGIDLAEIIEGQYPLMVSDKIDILLQICSGLAYAHELGVVHRDMKPANVRLTSRRVAKILDFGLARFDTTKLTRTGFLSGTIAYMSPERIGGQSGPSDDIFALGGIAYELLTYKRAYPGSSPPEIIYKIMSVEPPAVSTVIDLPVELDAIIARCMAKDPNERFQSADEFAEALRQFRNSEALHKFLSDDKRKAEIDKASEFFKDPQKFGATRNESSIRKVFSNTGERKTSAYSPTALNSPSETVAKSAAGAPGFRSTQSDTQYSTAETRIDSHPASPTRMVPATAITEIVPESGRANRWLIPAAIAAMAIIAIAFVVLRRPKIEPRTSAPVSVVTPQTSSTTAPSAAVSSPGSTRSWEIERELIRRLRADAASVAFSRAQRTRYQQAQAAADLAEKKFADHDDEGGGQLLTSAIRDLQTLLEEVQSSPARIAAAAPAPRNTTTPARKTSPAGVPPAPVREPERTAEVQPTPPPPSPEPRPVERHADVEPRVDYDSLRREINSFMRNLAAAYQDKNVDFFRSRHQKFSDQMATAVRSSPSTSVEYRVESVEFQGPSRATVLASRTDTFSTRGMDPATQRLSYQLVRTSDGWKIADSQRQKSSF